MKRRSISKKIRFEVLKRDSFKCQYCGQSAPDVLLVLDHIHPVALGGDSGILNLITSCDGCNSGKGAVKLTDHAVLEKTRDQLEALQERRNQLEMMMQWKNGLKSINDDSISAIERYWGTVAPGSSFTAGGKSNVRTWLKKFSVDEITSAIDVTAGHYFRFSGDGEITSESLSLGFSKIPGICFISRQKQSDPNVDEILYIRGILRNRFHLNQQQGAEALRALRESHSKGCPLQDLKELAIDGCDDFVEAMDYIKMYGDQDQAESREMRSRELAQEGSSDAR